MGRVAGANRRLPLIGMYPTEFRPRCDLQSSSCSVFQDFVKEYDGRNHDIQLPVPISFEDLLRGSSRSFASSMKIGHRGVWVEPSFLAQVEYRAKSAEGKVRHPFFKGIREDL